MQQPTNSESWRDPTEWGPVVLEVRRLRQFAGEDGLTQTDLATIAGISPRQLRAYEWCRSLPTSARSLLSIAVALHVPFEWLIEPRALAEIRADVEGRRAILASRARPSPRDEPSGP